MVDRDGQGEETYSSCWLRVTPRIMSIRQISRNQKGTRRQRWKEVGNAL